MRQLKAIMVCSLLVCSTVLAQDIPTATAVEAKPSKPASAECKEDGKLVRLIVVFSDITDLKNSDMQKNFISLCASWNKGAETSELKNIIWGRMSQDFCQIADTNKTSLVWMQTLLQTDRRDLSSFDIDKWRAKIPKAGIDILADEQEGNFIKDAGVKRKVRKL